jgi:hypothetical protein
MANKEQERVVPDRPSAEQILVGKWKARKIHSASKYLGIDVFAEPISLGDERKLDDSAKDRMERLARTIVEKLQYEDGTKVFRRDELPTVLNKIPNGIAADIVIEIAGGSQDELGN